MVSLRRMDKFGFLPGWLNWIEHQTSNLGVAGSSPASGAYTLLNIYLKLLFDIM